MRGVFGIFASPTIAEVGRFGSLIRKEDRKLILGCYTEGVLWAT